MGTSINYESEIHTATLQTFNLVIPVTILKLQFYYLYICATYITSVPPK